MTVYCIVCKQAAAPADVRLYKAGRSTPRLAHPDCGTRAWGAGMTKHSVPYLKRDGTLAR